MRKTLKIARLELAILFYSPVAWLVLTIFMIQCAIGFLDHLQSFRTSLSLGGVPPLTGRLFNSPSGLFTMVQGTVYLYIPILTMGLMSRETASGSIKLLLSSPVKLSQIIVGKYLAIIGYALTLIAVLALFGAFGVMFIKDADAGVIYSGLLGLYLLICAYAAIGLFMSCLTNYQVVAAISTLAVLAVLRYVGTIGQGIDLVRDLTYSLSLSGRTEKMLFGMITTKDLFYYAIIISAFLGLCVLRLRNDRDKKSSSVKAGRYALLVVCTLMLGYFTSRPGYIGYFDVTANKSLTITPNSQAIAKKLNGTLKITTYANLLAPNINLVLPEARNADFASLEPFERFIPGMQLNYVYYYEKPTDLLYQGFRYNPHLQGVTDLNKIVDTVTSAMGMNRSKFLAPSAVDAIKELRSEGYLQVRKLEYNGRTTFLRFFPFDPNPYPSEGEIAAALKKLTDPSPKVYFLTGNGERVTNYKNGRAYQRFSGLKTYHKALINNGFQVDTINLVKQDIPADADLLVLGDPASAFSPAEQQKLSVYINAGKNLYITGDPGHQQILNPLLQQFGVQLKPGILLTPDKNITPGFTASSIYKDAFGLDSNLVRMAKIGVSLGLQGTTAVTYQQQNGFRVIPVTQSVANAFNRKLDKPKPTENKPAPVVHRAKKAGPTMENLIKDDLPPPPNTVARKIVIQTPDGPQEITIHVRPPNYNANNPSSAPKADAAAKAPPAVDQPAQDKPTATAKNTDQAKTATQVKKQVDTAKRKAAILAFKRIKAKLDSIRKVKAGDLKKMATQGAADSTSTASVNQDVFDPANTDVTFNAKNGDEQGTFNTSVAVIRNVNGKQQRIFIAGDADFISNSEIAKSQANGYFNNGIVRWLSAGSYPIDITRADAKDIDLKISRGQITKLMWVCKGVIPALIIVLGAIVLFKRRRN